MHSGSLDGLLGAESIIGIHLHAKTFGYAGYIPAHVAKRQYAQFLAHQLGAAGTVVEVAHCIYQQSEHQFSHTVGILSGCVHSHHMMGSSSLQVDVVISSTCTHHYLQLTGSIQHLIIHLVRADDECICIGHCAQQLALLGIFLQQSHLASCLIDHFLYAIHSHLAERFFCCNKNFHVYYI